jgi:hypothetical protein
MSTELDRKTWEAQAYHEGVSAALTAASWLTISETDARSLVDDVDPAVVDAYPGPDLSGQWADAPTSESLAWAITGSATTADERDGLADQWEAGVESVWSAAREGFALRVLGDIPAALRVEHNNEIAEANAARAAARWSDLRDQWVPALSERVARGIALLDEMAESLPLRLGGWRDRVNWTDLAMANTRLCVLGQLFPVPRGAGTSDPFGWGARVLGLTVEQAVEFGFDIGYTSDVLSVEDPGAVTGLGGRTEWTDALYATLGDLWRSSRG